MMDSFVDMGNSESRSIDEAGMISDVLYNAYIFK